MHTLSEMFRFLTVGVVVLDACYYTHWAWQRRKVIPAKVKGLRQQVEVIAHRIQYPTVRHPLETREGELAHSSAPRPNPGPFGEIDLDAHLQRETENR